MKKMVAMVVMLGLVGCADRVDELHAECLDVAAASACQPSVSRPYRETGAYTLEDLCDDGYERARSSGGDGYVADFQARTMLSRVTAIACFARCCPVEANLAAACATLCSAHGRPDAATIESTTCLAARDACVAETGDRDTCDAEVRDPCLEHWGLDFSDIPRVE